MPRIKVLHIITRLDLGGTFEDTLASVLNLDNSKYEVTLSSGPSTALSETLISRLKQGGVRFVEIKQLRRQINIISDSIALYRIYRLIKNEKYAIVHTHTSKAGALGRLAAHLAKVPIIIHAPHGHIFYGYYGFFPTQLIILLEKSLASFTDRLITLTQLGKNDHIKFGIAPANKIVPIYSGIELDKFRQFNIDIKKKKDQFHLPLDSNLISVIARLAPVKGHRYFLEAAVRIIEVIPKARFLLIGEGPLRKKLIEQVKRLGLTKEVVFFGGCEDIRPFLGISDIVVLPSLNEGMGRILLQAQACGKPVVATRVGGVPEVVRDNETGLLVPAGDAAALADAIIYLLKDKEKRRAISDQAKRWVDSKFSVEAMVKGIANLYQELIREKGLESR